MQRRIWVGRRDAGASTLEYAATFAMAAILIIAVVWAARLTPFGPVMTDAVCKVSAAVGIGAARDGPEATAASRPTRPTSTSRDGLDPDSELVQQLLSTERGRQTLQWLSDNNIPIVIDPSATGAYWNGTEIVLGQGYDNAAVRGARGQPRRRPRSTGTSADANNQDRDDYVTTAVNEEVDGTVRADPGGPGAPDRRLRHRPATGRGGVRRRRTSQAIQNGQTRAQAERAGWEAVRGEFYNGNIVTSTNGQSLSRLLRRLLGQRELMRETWNQTGTRDRRTSMTGHPPRAYAPCSPEPPCW